MLLIEIQYNFCPLLDQCSTIAVQNQCSFNSTKIIQSVHLKNHSHSSAFKTLYEIPTHILTTECRQPTNIMVYGNS